MIIKYIIPQQKIKHKKRRTTEAVRQIDAEVFRFLLGVVSAEGHRYSSTKARRCGSLQGKTIQTTGPTRPR